jgi:hypothetical protein
VDLFDVVRSCFRRWYVVVPLLLIVAWYTHNVYKSVKPVYYSNAVIGVASPNTHMDLPPQGVAVSRNGLLDAGGGTTIIANMAALNLNEPAVSAPVVAAGGQPNYTAKMFPVPATVQELPMLMIEATEPDPAAASKTVELVVAQAGPTLRTLQQQANVPDDQMATAFVVSPPSVPAGGMPSRTKSTIAIGVAGVGIAILVGLVVDVLLMRWKAGRQKRRQTRVQTAGGADTADRADTAHAHEEENVHPQNRHATDEVAMDSR